MQLVRGSVTLSADQTKRTLCALWIVHLISDSLHRMSDSPSSSLITFHSAGLTIRCDRLRSLVTIDWRIIEGRYWRSIVSNDWLLWLGYWSVNPPSTEHFDHSRVGHLRCLTRPTSGSPDFGSLTDKSKHPNHARLLLTDHLRPQNAKKQKWNYRHPANDFFLHWCHLDLDFR